MYVFFERGTYSKTVLRTPHTRLQDIQAAHLKRSDVILLPKLLHIFYQLLSTSRITMIGTLDVELACDRIQLGADGHSDFICHAYYAMDGYAFSTGVFCHVDRDGVGVRF